MFKESSSGSLELSQAGILTRELGSSLGQGLMLLEAVLEFGHSLGAGSWWGGLFMCWLLSFSGCP